MNVTYLHHSCFLVESERFYYLFDYESGRLPAMDEAKPIFVFASHGHEDHYNPAIFPLLSAAGMQKIRAVLSDDIEVPAAVDVLSVGPGMTYDLAPQLRLTTFRSTDEGVAFLLEDGQTLLYHAGDLHDWVWDEESEAYNAKMTVDYRREIDCLARTLDHRTIDVAFVVLDPRQEKDYDRGLCWFLENIPVKQVYPMHYWGKPAIIETFLQEHPQYGRQIQRTE